MSFLNTLAALIGWCLIALSILGAIMPDTHLVVCFGSKAMCHFVETTE